jgi:hypothetical protein
MWGAVARKVAMEGVIHDTRATPQRNNLRKASCHQLVVAVVANFASISLPLPHSCQQQSVPPQPFESSSLTHLAVYIPSPLPTTRLSISTSFVPSPPSTAPVPLPLSSRKKHQDSLGGVREEEEEVVRRIVRGPASVEGDEGAGVWAVLGREEVTVWSIRVSVTSPLEGWRGERGELVLMMLCC